MMDDLELDMVLFPDPADDDRTARRKVEDHFERRRLAAELTFYELEFLEPPRASHRSSSRRFFTRRFPSHRFSDS